MNKFDRVISTLVLLQTKKVLTANFISERFDVSLRTVYRDINTLKTSGIPIIGDPGRGYSIMDGYRLPPIMFSEGEATAMLTAEKFIGNVTDNDTQAYYSSAMMKIKAILRSSEKQSLAVLEESIAFSDTNSRWHHKAYLQDLFKGIAGKQIIDIKYQKADGTNSERKIEAIGCYHQFSNWYVVAYCQSASDYRTFKMNRIIDLKILDEQFDTEHISLQKYIDQQKDSWKKEQQFHNIEIAFNKSLVKFAESRKYYFGFVEQEDKADAIHMKFLNSSLEIMVRWLIQFGDQATIIKPQGLKDRMKELVDGLTKQYS